MSRSRIKRHNRIARVARVRAALYPGFTGTLFDIWRRAREIFRQFFDCHDYSIQRLIACEYVFRAEHRTMSDWLCHLEHLVRNLILTAALTLKVALAPRPSESGQHEPRKRKRRFRIIWDDRPASWQLSFRIFPGASKSCGHAGTGVATPPRLMRSLPLARRLETLRRVLIDPQASARRAAFHLARLAAANRTSNQPHRLAVGGVARRTLIPTRGWQAIESSIEKLVPLLEDNTDAWNRAPEPG